MILGAQFFSFRDQCKTLEGLEDTMKRVADIGLTTIQLSGVCDYDPAWAYEKARENGLSIVLTHINYDKMMEDPQAMIDFHKTLHCPNIGIGTMPGWEITEEKYQKFLKDMKPVAEQIRAAGLQFMYHNHHIEFQKLNGKRVIDRLCEDFGPALNITFDTYWAQHAGADPAAYTRKLQGQLKVIHFKDMIAYVDEKKPYEVEHRIAALGEGNMNYPAIVQACVDTGVEYGMIELDDCYGEDPFDAVRRSYEYLKQFGVK